MNWKLKGLLFFLNNLSKQIDYKHIDAATVRKLNTQEFEKTKYLLDDAPIAMESIQDENISMRDGAEIPIRIYKPSKNNQRPVFVYFHGGGFVTRSIESHDRVCRRLAKINDMVVVSVGYRLAPEFPFPIPHQDSYDATKWIAENIQQYDGDAEQLIVGGDSAGGNLATVVSILARDLGGPKIAYQVLIYPTTDARLQSPSIDKYAKKYFLTKDLMQWFVNNYLPNEADKLNPLASPILTKDLSNLPPAFVCTAGLDPLKDEGKAYADRLLEAGNQVFFKEYPEVIHGFLNLPKITRKATLELHQDIKNEMAKFI